MYKTSFKRIKNEIRKLDSAIIAFSGGVDSVLVLKAAFDILGNKVIAITADSPRFVKTFIAEAYFYNAIFFSCYNLLWVTT